MLLFRLLYIFCFSSRLSSPQIAATALIDIPKFFANSFKDLPFLCALMIVLISLFCGFVVVSLGFGFDSVSGKGMLFCSQ
ncbi:MAG: hypothetical protein LBL39_00655 [Planctomycetaceae bacterium]|nr:hypothetical protein [Planctomycetaceae bacterium]